MYDWGALKPSQMHAPKHKTILWTKQKTSLHWTILKFIFLHAQGLRINWQGLQFFWLCFTDKMPNVTEDIFARSINYGHSNSLLPRALSAAQYAVGVYIFRFLVFSDMVKMAPKSRLLYPSHMRCEVNSGIENFCLLVQDMYQCENF